MQPNAQHGPYIRMTNYEWDRGVASVRGNTAKGIKGVGIYPCRPTAKKRVAEHWNTTSDSVSVQLLPAPRQSEQMMSNSSHSSTALKITIIELTVVGPSKAHSYTRSRGHTMSTEFVLCFSNA